MRPVAPASTTLTRTARGGSEIPARMNHLRRVSAHRGASLLEIALWSVWTFSARSAQANTRLGFDGERHQ